MKKSIFNSRLFFLSAILCLLAVMPGARTLAAAPETLSVSPEVLSINGFFSGGSLTVSGTLASDEDVIIEVTGKDTDNSFDLKGRIGPFWMTKGNVHVENLPELYLLALPQGPGWKEKAGSLNMGIAYLKNRMSTTGTVEIPADIFEMFSGLKKAQGLYIEVPDAVKYTMGTDGTRRFEAVCRLPALIEPGTYRVMATVVTDKGRARQMETGFSVEQIGFVKLIDNLASNRRILYGVTAVVIALAAGLIMGILFRQSERGH